MALKRETADLDGREIVFESGEIARQAGGAVVVRDGDTVLLATVTSERTPSGADFLPLTTEFRLRYSAAGRIPGSYDRREAKPSDAETLLSRLIDRAIRPFFPAAWRNETQIIIQPLSFAPESDMAVLGIAAASAALMVSDIPWDGPVAGVRIGRFGAAPIANPRPAELGESDLDLMVAVRGDGIVMVEGSAAEVSEDILVQAFALARASAAPLIAALLRLRAPEKAGVTADRVDDALHRFHDLARAPLRAALTIADKKARNLARAAARAEAKAALARGVDPVPENLMSHVPAWLDDIEKTLIRSEALDGRRIDGRGPRDIREISARVGWLARCHGSSLFTRGETQAIVTCTLGSDREAKSNDTLEGRQVERFLLHYSFPPYSVGETKPLRGPGRREIGHGHLARRALLAMLPREADMPYTVRLESLITESNGSSSMATVCGGTLALLAAGVDVVRPVAGIAMGLVSDGERFTVLSDILGDEDHVGDMDFKVCGTERGVTAIQLDSKLGALSDDVMTAALAQARDGRMHILDKMAPWIAEARGKASKHAPKTTTVQIEPNRIGSLVGSGGKTIKALQAETGASVEVSQDGLVRIFASSTESVERAAARVASLAGIPQLDEIYEGQVVSVQPFGSFVRIFDGVEGLLPDAALTLNTSVKVRVTGVSVRGKLVLEQI